ncbi:DnaJ-class molecular chaperone [Arthrobacter ginsengisoli]|uniref:DnaJ-class molecular chaperone n=1 Tax=Arthrobacter ginsengisoli TaxID=1356565 RepID=A0ABU1UBJ1_9MICC|nr:J domain-containing protein [Arthrobacter ginsengisoli]MDR7082532.1 DnaJ-class molecular chaperone [Arthrobacter ginsengisoli]
MKRDPRGYYAALHVTPDATPVEIQRAFRALMRRRHPDVGSSADAGSGAADDVRRILESFAVLRDPKSRTEYDPAAAGSGSTADGGTGSTGTTGTARSREIPVRHHRSAQPVLRVTQVRWERGPWTNTREGGRP